MEVAIRHGKIEISPALRWVVEDKLAHVCRFLGEMDRAEVRFSEERNPRIVDREVCEVTAHGYGHVVRARAAAPERALAFDLVVDKLEHRLGRLKGKLAGRFQPRRPTSVHFAPIVGDGAAGEPDHEPRIVKTKRFEMKAMTPEEAALQMELVGHDFYVFTSSETGQAGVVYRRHDGQIGLIDAI